MSANKQKKAVARQKAWDRAKRRRAQHENNRDTAIPQFSLRPGELLPPGYAALHELPGVAKMSEVILEFLEPYEDFWESIDSLRNLLLLAEVAWNACLMPQEEQKAFIQKVGKAIPPELLPLVADMMARKMTYFADHDRYILDFKLTETKDGPHLQVRSTFAPPVQ